MSKPVRGRVRRQKEEETVEKSIVIVNYMENGYCRSVHGDILLPSEDTEMGAKIILLGYGGFSNRCLHPVCGKLQ